jgi:prepilin-type N-terminal cleavage/methylation domain-containing protein
LEGEISTAKITNSTKGFTLIEMVVVIAIISFLFAIGIGALAGTRDQAKVSAAAEEILSALRDAQNRSVAVQKGDLGDSTKVWGVKVDNTTNQVSLFYLFLADANNITNGLGGSIVKTLPIDPSVDVTTYFNDGNTGDVADTNLRYMMFTTPFGTAVTAENSCTTSNVVGCGWGESPTNPSKEWIIMHTTGAGEMFSKGGNDKVKIKVRKGNFYYDIYFNDKGDSYIVNQ